MSIPAHHLEVLREFALANLARAASEEDYWEEVIVGEFRYDLNIYRIYGSGDTVGINASATSLQLDTTTGYWERYAGAEYTQVLFQHTTKET